MHVVLDVDTGVDDALAILFAVRHPDVDVLAITCVTGNVPVAQVLTNTLTVLDVAGAPDIPVARGAGRPLRVPPPTGRSVHGSDGLADLGLPQPVRSPVGAPAVDLLRETLNAAEEPVTICALAPLTNIAALLQADPGIARRIAQLVVIGGGFNASADPDATDLVYGSGVPISPYGPEVFYAAALTRADAGRLASSADPSTQLAGRLAQHQVRRFGGRSGTIGDAGAVVGLTAPNAGRTGEGRAYAGWFLDCLRSRSL